MVKRPNYMYGADIAHELDNDTQEEYVTVSKEYYDLLIEALEDSLLYNGDGVP